MKIYALLDRVAGAIIGGILNMYAHDEVAIRAFGDWMTTEGSVLAKHVEDYNLICVGELSGTEIVPCQREVITGRVWKAAQEPTVEASGVRRMA